MQNIQILDVFLNFDYTKTAKMPEGPFCQIHAHIYFAPLLLEDCFSSEVYLNLISSRKYCMTEKYKKNNSAVIRYNRCVVKIGLNV